MLVIKMTEKETNERLILKDQVINYLLVENKKLNERVKGLENEKKKL